MSPSTPADRRPRVLVVEDDEDVRLTLARVLIEEGYEAETADDGEAALQRLLGPTAPPDLLILDLWMPKVDGRRVLARLRQEPRLARMPVVVLSASDLGEGGVPPDGPVEVVRKPIRLEDLLARLAALAPR